MLPSLPNRHNFNIALTLHIKLPATHSFSEVKFLFSVKVIVLLAFVFITDMPQSHCKPIVSRMI